MEDKNQRSLSQPSTFFFLPICRFPPLAPVTANKPAEVEPRAVSMFRNMFAKIVLMLAEMCMVLAKSR